MREHAGDVIVRFSSWHAWGPAGSWRRKLLPFAAAVPAGFALAAVGKAFTLSNGAVLLLGVAMLAVLVPLGCCITFGPFTRGQR